MSRPFLNVSGAASQIHLGTNPRVPLARIHQTATIGLRRLELRLDYAGGGGEVVLEQSGMWLNAGGIKVSDGR